MFTLNKVEGIVEEHAAHWRRPVIYEVLPEEGFEDQIDDIVDMLCMYKDLLDSIPNMQQYSYVVSTTYAKEYYCVELLFGNFDERTIDKLKEFVILLEQQE